MKPQSKIPNQKSKPLRLLVVEDSPRDAEIAVNEIQRGGFDVTWKRVETAEAMGAALREETWDIIECDYNMPNFSGLDAIALLKETGIDIPLIIVSGTIGEEVAVECMRHGAQDYIMKDNLSRLVPAIERELQEAESRRKCRLAEKALRESEEKYRIIAENTADQIAILDMNLHFTYVSPNIMRLRGLTVDEAMAQTLEQVLTPESIKLGLTVFEEEMQLEASGKADPYRTRILEVNEYKKDGSIICVEVNFSFLRDNDGKPIEIIMVSRDITERKEAEQELRNSEEKYRSILETMQESYFEVDYAGSLTFFNDSLCRLLGYSKEELMGMNNRQYTDKEHSKKLFQVFNEVYNTGKTTEGFDWQIIRKDGTERYVEASVSLQKDSSGKPIGFRGIARDVTERKQAEEALRASEELFRNYLEYAPDGVYTNELNGTFLYGNRRCEEIIGYKREELIGKNFLELNILPGKSLNKAIELLQLNMEGKPTGPDEIELISKEGRLIPVEINTSVVQRNGEGIVLAFVRDITERKQAEEALRVGEIRYRELFENMGSGVAVYETHNDGEDFIFKEYNAAAEMIDKTPRGQVIGRSVVDMFPGVKDIGLFDVFQRVYRTGKPERHPVTFYKDKKISGWRDNYIYKLPSGEIVAVFDDVTERKQAADNLKESENKYRLLAENVNDVIFVMDMNLKYTYVSPSVKILRGYEPEEVLKNTSAEVLTPASMELAMKTLSEFMELEKSGRREEIPVSKTLQLEMIRKDGTTVWTEVKFSLVRDKDQRPVGIIGVTRDITERKRSESQREAALEALRESEANYKQLFDNAPSAIYQVDFRTGKFLKANDVICKYFCCSQEEITSLSPYDLLTKESQILFLERLNKMTKGDQVPANPEYEFVDKKGKRRWLKLNAKNIYDSEGLAGADVIAHDITDRKQAEQELMESKDLVDTVVENIPLMVFLKEAKDLRFVMFNRAGEELLGYDRKDLLGKNNLDLFPPEQAAHFMAKDREVLDGKAIMMDIPEEEILTAKKGQRLLHTKKVCIRSTDGTTKYLLGISEDITERKQAEAKLQQTLESLRKSFSTTVQVMASAVEVKDPYTAGHQLRVADLARFIATEMELSPEIIEGIRMAGTIHDIGKLSVPAEILTKPTKLSEAEFSIIKEHSQKGYDMLKDVESPWPLAQIVYQHHERMNGSGYPRKLKGDEILMEARIMAVADVVEAMASYRPYRPALGIEAALAEIEKNRETLYDKTVADVCLKLFREKDYQLT